MAVSSSLSSVNSVFSRRSEVGLESGRSRSGSRSVNTGTITSSGSPVRPSVSASSLHSPERWTTDDIILDAPSLDWLTLTTRSSDAFYWAVSLLELYTIGDKREARVMQYKGVSSDGWFAGRGEQFDSSLGIHTPHYMVRVSGSVAHRFIVEALGSPSTRFLEHFKCTRVDVQYTSPIQLPHDIRLSDLAPLLENVEWSGRPGPRPAVSAFRAPDGLDTLYIGTRKTGYRRLVRIYQKDVAGMVLPRFEVEYKQELAADIWRLMVSEGLRVLGGILAREIACIPLCEVCEQLHSMLLSIASNPQVRVKVQRAKRTTITTMRWLHTHVLPAIRRLYGEEDERLSGFIDAFLQRASEYGAVMMPEPAQFVAEFFIESGV